MYGCWWMGISFKSKAYIDWSVCVLVQVLTLCSWALLHTWHSWLQRTPPLPHTLCPPHGSYFLIWACVHIHKLCSWSRKHWSQRHHKHSYFYTYPGLHWNYCAYIILCHLCLLLYIDRSTITMLYTCTYDKSLGSCMIRVGGIWCPWDLAKKDSGLCLYISLHRISFCITSE